MTVREFRKRWMAHELRGVDEARTKVDDAVIAIRDFERGMMTRIAPRKPLAFSHGDERRIVAGDCVN